MNKKGFSLIELIVVMIIGFFILEAAYLLYTGSIKLFRDVRTKSDNLQTKMPSMELIGRYFDRWGVGVYATGSGIDCSNYPPSNAKCIKVTAGTPCDEVTFWGNIYGMGFVKDISGTTAQLMSCRLSNNADHKYFYLVRNNELKNELDTSVTPNKPKSLSFSGNLSSDNADCISNTTYNATVDTSMTDGAATKTIVAGDVLHRVPFKIRIYCSLNSADDNSRWLYVQQTDMHDNVSSPAEAIAPVNSFKVEPIPSSSTCLSTGGTGCSAVKLTVTFRSQSKKYDRTTSAYTVERIFGR